MVFEWDKAKNRANIAKHGVDFADSVAVFEDDLALTRPDADSRDERRALTLGMDGFGRLLVVVFVEPGPGRTRIISARPASKQERKNYEN